VGSGSPCSGCSEPDFPENHGLGIYGQLSRVDASINSGFIRHADTIAKGTVGVTAAGIALHAISKRTSVPLRKHQIFSSSDDEQ
jgi:Ni,Fe-hydrogenase I small subunit